jgi:hypothetical protein
MRARPRSPKARLYRVKKGWLTISPATVGTATTHRLSILDMWVIQT